MAKSDKKQNGQSDPVLARNRKAFHEYEIMETLETGIELRGTEVKSCRMRSIQLQEAFARIDNGQLLVFGLHISPYTHGNRFNHDPVRSRRLLAHKREILRLSNQVKTKGYALVPLKAYLKNGRVKIELALARGKTFGDKRETLRKKQDDLDTRRNLGARR